MPDHNVVKKAPQFKVLGIRKRGRPRLRWADSVESDFEIINEKTWRTKKRVAINSGPKNPKDLLKKRRVRRHKSVGDGLRNFQPWSSDEIDRKRYID
ncbi:hypothetical protein TNCV_2728811 [Trichonephila clavipes]|nr:hypothetical protein TNCV_2728811 [Trichonephila clavipes]